MAAFRVLSVIKLAPKPLCTGVLLHPASTKFRPHWTKTSKQLTTKSHASRHWVAERGVSIGLLGLGAAAFVSPGGAVDYALAATLVLHSYWGVQQLITDYVHTPGGTRFSSMLLQLMAAATFASLCSFNYNDVGICRAVAMLWSL
uniref:Succinate dehydrogenase [ubiquinone] cytochrome b small subunit n=1 Tax=Eptatretus burgeri TaxID=7764 RepID=A0A8C4Q935_EPTBU